MNEGKMHQQIEEILDNADFMDEALRRMEEEIRNAKKCRCGNRCDRPYGNGYECITCASRPTTRDMGIIIY